MQTRALRFELAWVAEAPNADYLRTAVVRRTRERVLAMAVVAFAIVVAALATSVMWTERSRTIGGRFDVLLPQNLSFDNWSDAPLHRRRS